MHCDIQQILENDCYFADLISDGLKLHNAEHLWIMSSAWTVIVVGRGDLKILHILMQLIDLSTCILKFAIYVFSRGHLDVLAPGGTYKEQYWKISSSGISNPLSAITSSSRCNRWQDPLSVQMNLSVALPHSMMKQKEWIQ